MHQKLAYHANVLWDSKFLLKFRDSHIDIDEPLRGKAVDFIWQNAVIRGFDSTCCNCKRFPIFFTYSYFHTRLFHSRPSKPIVSWWRHQMVTFSASPVNSPHKGQWRGALMFSFICAWINGWVNNRGAGDLRRLRTHYDVLVMSILSKIVISNPYI